MTLRPVTWVGSSLRDTRAMPEAAKEVIGHALHRAQHGAHHPGAKPLKGIPGVYEIVADIATDTYRLVYVVGLPDAVYVLHAFKKKSISGIATRKKDIDLIRSRLRQAKEVSDERSR